MELDVIFLDVQPGSNPSFAEAEANSRFYNFSQPTSRGLTSSEANTLAVNGVSIAIASAGSEITNQSGFSTLFSLSAAAGEGTFIANSNSRSEVVADFEVDAGQTFSFDFDSQINLEAREIENPSSEYSEVAAKTSFLVLDISQGIEIPRIIGFFGSTGYLISSLKSGDLRFGISRNVSFSSSRDIDIDGNNGVDFVIGSATGRYQRTLSHDAHLAVIEINASEVELSGDNRSSSLGADVYQGSSGNDLWRGTYGTDKFYGGLGNDTVYGKGGDDILEGGAGRDRLNGEGGNDKIHGAGDADRLNGGRGNDTLVGGQGNDTIVGGSGSDEMTGGQGRDRFVFERSHLRGGYDVVIDFEIDKDSLEFRGLGQVNPDSFHDTADGALYRFNGGGGEVLLAGVNAAELGYSNFA